MKKEEEEEEEEKEEEEPTPCYIAKCRGINKGNLREYCWEYIRWYKTYGYTAYLTNFNFYFSQLDIIQVLEKKSTL